MKQSPERQSSSFYGADFYTADIDSGIYNHTEWRQCLIDFIGDVFDGPVEGYSGNPITIYAAKRMTIADKWYFWVSKQAATLVDELFFDDYGSIDGQIGIDIEKVRKAIEAAMRGTIKNSDVWRCEIVAEKTFNLKEILEIVK